MVGRMIPRRLGMTRLAWVDFPVERDWAADSSSLKGNSTDSEWQGYRGGWSVEGSCAVWYDRKASIWLVCMV